MRSLMSILGWSACPGLALLLGLAASAQATERDAAVARARTELAETLHTTPEEFELESIEAIGRPASGLRCGPALPPGEGADASAWRVQLRRGGRTFEVRVAGDEAVVCLFGGAEPPRPGVGPKPSRGPVERGLAEQTDGARADLAGRLSILSDEIELLEAVSVVWRDSSAGCPRPKMEYMQVLTPGSRIRLRAGQRVYQYHAREGGVPFLCEDPSPVEPLQAETE